MYLRSIESLPPQDLLAFTHHPSASRVLDAIIDGPTIPPRSRRSLLRALEAQFADVIDDRIGSRVGERCWAAADPYLKVRRVYPPITRNACMATGFFIFTADAPSLGEARSLTAAACCAPGGFAVCTVLHAWIGAVAAPAQAGRVAPPARNAIVERCYSNTTQYRPINARSSHQRAR